MRSSKVLMILKVLLCGCFLFTGLGLTPVAQAAGGISIPIKPIDSLVPIYPNLPIIPIDPTILNFPDIKFKEEVNKYLGLDKDTVLRQSDIDTVCMTPGFSGKTLTIHNFSGKITSIEGMQYLQECPVSIIVLEDHEIVDLTPMSALKGVTQLNLKSNKIESLDPLSHLSNLTHINIASNRVTDLTPISGLKLTELRVFSNPISDISMLKSIATLKLLHLSSTKIVAISDLNGMNLESLYLENVLLQDLKPLATMPKLSTLSLNRISLTDDTDLAPLSLLPNLQILHLSGNSLKSIASLMNLDRLKTLGLSNNEIQDLSPLASFASLKNLDISSNKVSDLSGLSHLSNLTSLKASYNAITELKPIEQLKLTTAIFNNNKIDVVQDSNKTAIAYWKVLGATINLDNQELTPSSEEPTSTPTTPPTPPQDEGVTTKIPFVDIKGHWAEPDIQWAYDLNMVSGTAPGIFAPDKSVTEAEFLKMLLIAMKAIKEDPPSSPWHQKYVDLAVSYRYPVYPGKQNEKITRGSVAELIAATQGKKLKGNEAIQYLLDNKLSKGKTAATIDGYKGTDVLTRAESVRFIRNVLSEAEYSIAQSLAD